MIGIYKITSPSGRVYIGQSLNIIRRFKTYKSLDCITQVKLYNSLNKYGINEHIFEVIEGCLIDDLNCRERFWQDYYDVLNGGLNCILQECGENRRVFSEDIRNKRSIAFSGENNPNFGKSLKGKDNHFYGKNHSDNTKNLMSVKKLGKPSPRKGVFLKPSTVELIASQKRIPINQYDLENNFIKEWSSSSEAEKVLSIFNIVRNLKGKTKTAGGFIWRYKNIMSNKLDIGDKILCVDASIPSHMVEEIQNDFEMWIKKGAEYTVRGFNENDGIVVGVLLEEIHNFPKFFRLLGRTQEPAFKLDRFRKLNHNEVSVEVEEFAEIY